MEEEATVFAGLQRQVAITSIDGQAVSRTTSQVEVTNCPVRRILANDFLEYFK